MDQGYCNTRLRNTTVLYARQAALETPRFLPLRVKTVNEVSQHTPRPLVMQKPLHEKHRTKDGYIESRKQKRAGKNSPKKAKTVPRRAVVLNPFVFYF